MKKVIEKPPKKSQIEKSGFKGYLRAVKGNKNTNPFLAFATFAGLVMLLLLSPCSVRNSIQSFLGHQQTEVSNKSKSTIAGSTCDASETIELLHSKTPDSKTHSLDAVAIITAFKSFSKAPQVSFFIPGIQQINSGLSVPFYILYQNLKVAL